MKDEISMLKEEAAWIRRKLGLPEDTPMFSGSGKQDSAFAGPPNGVTTVAGTLHVVCSGHHGMQTYIKAFRCDDKQGEIARLTVDLAEAREKMENLLAVIREVQGQRADDTCWLDIDRVFQAAGLPVPDRRVGDKAAMLNNCARYLEVLCEDGGWKSYAELEEELRQAGEEIERLNVIVSKTVLRGPEPRENIRNQG